LQHNGQTRSLFSKVAAWRAKHPASARRSTEGGPPQIQRGSTPCLSSPPLCVSLSPLRALCPALFLTGTIARSIGFADSYARGATRRRTAAYTPVPP
jgi:hypothetical protein